MGKSAMCFKMLQLLNNGEVYKVSKLAKLLNTKPRNVLEYKKEIDDCFGEDEPLIETVSGRYGGYRLTKKIFVEELSNSDINIITKVFEYFLENNENETQKVQNVYNKLINTYYNL